MTVTLPTPAVTVELGRKFVPFSVTRVAELPIKMPAGTIELREGVEFPTVKVTDPLVPPAGAGLVTVIL